MSTKGGPVYTFVLPGGADRSLAPRQLRHCSRVNLFENAADIYHVRTSSTAGSST